MKCYREGCTERATRHHPGDTFAKCETHFQEDRAQPWGSVLFSPEPLPGDQRNRVRR